MSVFLRWIGIVNAAIWFGASVFLVFALTAIFSPEIQQVFEKAGDKTKYYSGAVAMAVVYKYFALQYFCGFMALAHLLAEKLYLGRAFSRIGTSLVGTLLFLALIGGFGFQPKMEKLRSEMYSAPQADQRVRAEHSFKTLHAVSQCVNVLVLAGLLVHLLRVSRPEESRYYGTLFPQFRG